MEPTSSIQTCTLDGHLHRVPYTRCRIDTIDYPDDEHRGCSKHVQNWNNYIQKKRNVRQDGYLQDLDRDAQSTKHKILYLKTYEHFFSTFLIGLHLNK